MEKNSVGSGKKTKFSTYCIVRDDPKIKHIINYMFESGSYNIDKVCEGVGISKSNLLNFLNQNKKNVSQFKIINLLDHMGINVEVKLEIRKNA